MGKKRKVEEKALKVTIEHLPASDATARLRRAFELVLQAVAQGDENRGKQRRSGL